MDPDPSTLDPAPDDTTPPESGGNWYDSLDADLRGNPSITKYKDIGELAKGHISLASMIGKDKVVLPTEESTSEEVNSFYQKLGVPAEANNYQVPTFDGVPDELKMPEAQLEAFKVYAKEKNIPQHIFNDVLEFYYNTGVKSQEAQQKKMSQMTQEAESALRAEWGDAYEANVDNAQQMINQFFNKKLSPESVKVFNMLSHDKGFIQAMADIASNMREDTLKGRLENALTPDAANSKLQEIMDNKQHPYYIDSHPEHIAAVQQVIDLQMAVMSGGKQ